MYKIFFIGNSDYLVIDKDYRFDGTIGARNLLYFTCGAKIIDSEEIKNQLWVPNLADKIMKGESISGKKLIDLNICDQLSIGVSK